MDYIKKPIRSSAVLTTSYVAGTVLENTLPHEFLVLLLDFTKGSLTTLEVIVEFSPDNTNWYQESNEDGITDVNKITVAPAVRQYSATGKYRSNHIYVRDRYIRISAKGTGTVTNSLLAIDAILGD